VQIGCAAHFVPCEENDEILTEWQGDGGLPEIQFFFWQAVVSDLLKCYIKQSSVNLIQFF